MSTMKKRITIARAFIALNAFFSEIHNNPLDAFNQGWFNVGPATTTLGQH